MPAADAPTNKPAASPGGSRSETPSSQDQADPLPAVALTPPDPDTLPELEPAPIPDQLALLVRQRLSVLLQLSAFDAARRVIAKTEGLPDKASSELSRQAREIKRMPTFEVARATREKLTKRLTDLKPDPDGADEQDGDESASDGGQDKPAPHPQLVEALELGVRQAALFEQRAELTDRVITAGAAVADDEPLYRLLLSHDVDAEEMYGWTLYALALEQIRQTTRKKADEANEKLAKAEKSRVDAQIKAQLQMQAQAVGRLVTAAQRELKTIEPAMADAFWSIYEAAAVVYATAKLEPSDANTLRAFLRYGVIITQPWMLPRPLVDFIQAECAAFETEWNHDVNATHVLYADEYIFHAAHGHITPSIDEDLELNDKGSEAWRVDKLWRKIVASKLFTASYEQTRAELEEKVAELTQANDAMVEEVGGLDRSASNFKAKRAELNEKIQTNKVDIARLQRAIEILVQQRLPDEQAAASEANHKLCRSAEPLTPELIARREARAVRRMCRLLAKLKEPFLPFVVRDYYRPGTAAVNDRSVLLHHIDELEKRDCNIYREILAHAKKEENRIYIRYSPYFVLMPCRGIMNMAWNPRSGTEVGRIAMSLLDQRPGGIDKSFIQVMSDFRYDTSKESAGVDLLTSDTLVAAYATVRWNYRKRSKDIREKAGIFNEEKDRVNWRRHYGLFVASAFDAGKKLFFKCPEVYDAVCKYIGLPNGQTRLKQN